MVINQFNHNAFILRDITNNMATHKTGEKAPVSGIYRYDGPADDKISCTPTQEEMLIPLSRGETFPPVKSCDSAAHWKLVKET
ncbi:MAG: hypothetical protein HMLIMOIP_000245 [Candidatus Nitrosomirales archaeon]|jgi:hypothetical protein